jgi:hypothetical protein
LAPFPMKAKEYIQVNGVSCLHWLVRWARGCRK